VLVNEASQEHCADSYNPSIVVKGRQGRKHQRSHRHGAIALRGFIFYGALIVSAMHLPWQHLLDVRRLGTILLISKLVFSRVIVERVREGLRKQRHIIGQRNLRLHMTQLGSLVSASWLYSSTGERDPTATNSWICPSCFVAPQSSLSRSGSTQRPGELQILGRHRIDHVLCRAIHKVSLASNALANCRIVFSRPKPLKIFMLALIDPILSRTPLITRPCCWLNEFPLNWVADPLCSRWTNPCNRGILCAGCSSRFRWYSTSRCSSRRSSLLPGKSTRRIYGRLCHGRTARREYSYNTKYNTCKYNTFHSASLCSNINRYSFIRNNGTVANAHDALAKAGILFRVVT